MSRTFTTDTLFLSVNDVSQILTTNPIVMDTYSQISISVKISDAYPLDGNLWLQISNKIEEDYEDYEDSLINVTATDTYIYNVKDISYRYIKLKYEPFIGTPDLNIQVTRKA